MNDIHRAGTAARAAQPALLKAGVLQEAIFNSPYFSCIATDAQGVIQLFNVGAERMLGYQADEVINQITPAGIFRSGRGHQPRHRPLRGNRYADRARF